jgi:hypothetical protein
VVAGDDVADWHAGSARPGPAGEQESTPSGGIEAAAAAVSMAVLADTLPRSPVEETSIVDYDYMHC